MNFEKDVFISYAHIDDEALRDGTKGWITEFHSALEVRLSQILGERPVIWRDSKLQGNDFFSPEIESQFPKLKLMISIVSPRYVKSDWCKKEVNLFYNATNSTGGLVIDNKSRIFKIIKTPVELNDQPEIMKSILGYDFFRIDPETKRPREFGIHGKEKEIEIQYWTKLDDVAYDVAQLINKMEENETMEDKPDTFITLTPNNEYTKRNIYLAETSYDLEEHRNNLKRELENKGFTVFPDKNIKPIAAIYINEVNTMMKECSLSIHLMGSSSYGLVPDGDERSIMVIQNELASAQSKTNSLSRLIWIPEITKAEDRRLIEFIDKLKHTEELQIGSDLLHGSIEEFKFAIFDTLKELDKAEKAKEALKNLPISQPIGFMGGTGATAVESDIKRIYLVCDQRDLASVSALDDLLFNSGFEVWKSIFDGSQEELAQAHEDSLRDCDAVLIYYGNANEAWLRAKISELKRKPAYPGSKPLLFSTVYLGDPISTSKATYRSRDVNLVVNGLNGFQPDLLNDFIQKLK